MELPEFGLLGKKQFTRWLISKYDNNFPDGKLLVERPHIIYGKMEQLLCSRKSKKTYEERNQKQDEKNSSRKIKSHKSRHTRNESIPKCSICHSTDYVAIVANDGPFGMN